MDEKKSWFVGVCNTEGDGVDLRRVYGTKDEVKGYLAGLVKESREDAAMETGRDSWEYGTEDADEVEEDSFGRLQAYAVYSTYHIDYTAVPEKETPAICLG